MTYYKPNKKTPVVTVTQHFSIPEGLDDKYQLPFIHFCNQLLNKVKTLRDCHLSAVTDIGFAYIYYGYYDYGIRVTRAPFILSFRIEEGSFKLFSDSGYNFFVFKK